MTTYNLSESDRALLDSALSIARDEYAKIAAIFRGDESGLPREAADRMAEQFDRQHEQAVWLLGQVENVESVTYYDSDDEDERAERAVAQSEDRYTRGD